jgi:hypothetical protein
MPISPFQKKILSILKSNRSPDSYVAGGTAIQRDPASLRFSADIDFFHDADQAVADAFQKDRVALINAGYTFDIQISQPSFYRATIGKSGEQLKLEWVRDTAFRYFPVVSDEDLGFRLHDVDLAINKCLALANRSVVRDALDILELNRKVLSLPAMISAACGKDPGFTPELMLDMIQRHLTFTPGQLAVESLAKKIDPVQLKKELIDLIERTKKNLRKIPVKCIGCLFTDKSGNIVADLSKLDLDKHMAHHGSIRGSWPRVVDE